MLHKQIFKVYPKFTTSETQEAWCRPAIYSVTSPVHTSEACCGWEYLSHGLTLECVFYGLATWELLQKPESNWDKWADGGGNVHLTYKLFKGKIPIIINALQQNHKTDILCRLLIHVDVSQHRLIFLIHCYDLSMKCFPLGWSPGCGMIWKPRRRTELKEVGPWTWPPFFCFILCFFTLGFKSGSSAILSCCYDALLKHIGDKQP